MDAISVHLSCNLTQSHGGLMKKKLSFFSLIILFSAVTMFPLNTFSQVKPFLEQWNDSSSALFSLYSPGQCLARSNVTSDSASDHKALKLTVSTSVQPGAGKGPEVGTKTANSYGIYSARLKTTDCTGQPDAGIVTGLFTYFNDGTDKNGNGLPDNNEIDFEWLGAEPQSIYLTMWTDYRDSDEKHKCVSRKINLNTGKIERCYYEESFDQQVPLTGLENQPTQVPALPGYNSATSYYEYGFSWSSNRVTWWIVNPVDGSKIILWDYQGPATRISAPPTSYEVNVWYTNSWTPESRPTAIKPPTSPFSAYVDWIRFDTLPLTDIHPYYRADHLEMQKSINHSYSSLVDCLGRRIAVDKSNVHRSSGLYLYRFGSGEHADVGKLLISVLH